MTWFFLSLAAALSLATSDAFTKKYYGHLSAYEMGVARLSYAFPWLLVALWFVPWPHPDRVFFLCLAAGLPLECLAFYCYMKAIKVSPLSISLPFLAFTPAFVIVTGRLILGESISMWGCAGILLIVIGSYCLNLSHIKTGLFEPFKAILKEPGSRLMLVVSFVYSITATVGKLAILHSNPYFFGVVYFVIFTLIMISFFPVVSDAKLSHVTQRPWVGLVLGATVAIMIFCHMLAISMVEAAYMLSLKRTSLLFGVLYGALWFKEEKIRERLTGAAIMISGVLLIGWFG